MNEDVCDNLFKFFREEDWGGGGGRGGVKVGVKNRGKISD